MFEYWLYVSESVTPPRSADDALIYLQACNRNPPNGITGYLHREERHYAQYIEGPPVALRRLHRQILTDGRHHNVRTLTSGRTEARRFAGWDMAFSTHEIVSFRLFQRRWGRTEDLREATPEHVLAFMEETAQHYDASGLVPNRPSGAYARSA